MKRILVPGILVCALVVWHASQPSFADKTQSDKAAKWEQVTFKPDKGAPVNVMVLRIWDSAAADPKWPQLALLRLPPAVYKVLRNDPNALKTFIDGTKTGKSIFGAEVTITDDCKLPEPTDKYSDGDNTSSLVIVSHRASHASCTALQEQAMGN